jgi:acyl-CoA thioesterase-1
MRARRGAGRQARLSKTVIPTVPTKEAAAYLRCLAYGSSGPREGKMGWDPRRRYRAVGLIAVLATILPMFVSNNACAQAIKIVAIGGSSTAGQGVSRSEAYPAKLEAALKAKGLNVAVVNAGISGDTSAGGLARIDSVAPAGTQVVIVELGINDAGKGINLETTVENVNAIVKRVRSRGAQVLVIGYRGGGGTLEKVAAAAGGRFMTFSFPGHEQDKFRVAGDPQKAAKGYAHFSGAGYDKIVEIMLPHVVALIGKK